jgi:SAM-dependent methyltransferase
LELDPACVAPAPIATVEIHRQPGGYVSEQVPGDVSAGLRYLGSGLIYSPGKGNTAGAEARGAYIAAQVTQRFPALRPRRILDLGCGIGLASQGIARAFPEAEYTAIDVAAPLLRYAFLQAAERGARIQFKQRDAAHTGFVPQSYDLIVSNIMLHETSATHVPAIMRECYRLLAPAGAMLHLDVATQRARLPFADQVMNDWQVRWNGEPFWTGFASLDVRSAIEAAGFAREKVFTDYPAKDGGGAWFVFGAQK